MTPNSSLNRPGNDTPAGPPPPSRPTGEKKPKRSRKLLIGGISAGVVLALGGGGLALALTTNDEKLAEYEEAHSDLTSAHSEATDLVDDADPLEPEKREELEGQLSHVNAVLNAEAPGVLSFGIDDRIEELREVGAGLEAPTSDLEDAMEHRQSFTSSTRDAESVLADAEELLETTADEVLDDAAHDELTDFVADLEAALETDPDQTSGEAFAAEASTITEASDSVSSGMTTVEESHDEWVKAEEEAAKTDPDNYDTLTERDWQLIERSPDAHAGEQYVLYGAVTQADSNMGIFSIRANTGPVQQSRRFDYDANTIVQADSLDLFEDVVQDDHVKMLVEVEGALSYDTTIGGSTTAVEVTAYDIEVLGQF